MNLYLALARVWPCVYGVFIGMVGCLVASWVYYTAQYYFLCFRILFSLCLRSCFLLVSLVWSFSFLHTFPPPPSPPLRSLCFPFLLFHCIFDIVFPFQFTLSLKTDSTLFLPFSFLLLHHRSVCPVPGTRTLKSSTSSSSSSSPFSRMHTRSSSRNYGVYLHCVCVCRVLVCNRVRLGM